MALTSPFVIFGLPRSRTFWLSRFLTYRDWTCGHEEARHVRGLKDISSWFSQGNAGTAETAAAPYWRLLLTVCPAVRIVVVRRPVEEVVYSLMDAGVGSDVESMTRTMTRFDQKLVQIERRVPGVLSVRYANLTNEATCAQIFEYCLPYDHDPEWWECPKDQNLQINLRALTRYESAHSDQLRVAKSICDQESRAMLWRNRKVSDVDGMTFQEEDLGTLLRDGRELFAQHCADVGESTDNFFYKNLPLMDRLEENGAVHIMTARCNGRIFGYLASVTGPSLEDENLQIATQGPFYVSRDTFGLGLRLQRASIAALKARGGTWEIIQRAGVRGSGPKLGVLYKRLGAEPYGDLYKLRVQ